MLSAAGIDGVISDGEYTGEVENSEAAGVSSNIYYMETRGMLLSGDNMKIALKIESSTDPRTEIVNSEKWSEYLYVELGLGCKNVGDFADNELVRVDVNGKASGAIAKVNTVEESGKYTTIIEMYVPSTSIANNTNSGQLVHLMRNYMYSNKLDDGVGVAAASNGAYGWWYITPSGISHQ